MKYLHPHYQMNEISQLQLSAILNHLSLFQYDLKITNMS
jgi:hypothetical protein